MDEDEVKTWSRLRTQPPYGLELLPVGFKLNGLAAYLSWSRLITCAFAGRGLDGYLTREGKWVVSGKHGEQPTCLCILGFSTPWFHQLPPLLMEFKMWRIFGRNDRKPMLGGKIAWQCFKLNEDRSLQGRYNELGVCHWTRAFNGLTMNFLAYHNVYSKENHAIFKTSQPVARSKQGNSSSQG